MEDRDAQLEARFRLEQANQLIESDLEVGRLREELLRYIIPHLHELPSFPFIPSIYDIHAAVATLAVKEAESGTNC